MRFILMIKANDQTEAGVPPTQEQLQGMTALMEEMANAGILLGGDGLKPSSYGKRIKIADGRIVDVTDGPFAETKELIAGFAIVQVDSYEDLQPWMERFAAVQGDGDCEVRPFYEPTDFVSEGFTAEDAAREEALQRSLGHRK